MVRKLNTGVSAHPLVAKLFGLMNEQAVQLDIMSDKSGVGKNALTDWRYRTNPNVPNLEACLNVVGFKLIAVPMDFNEEKETKDTQPFC